MTEQEFAAPGNPGGSDIAKKISSCLAERKICFVFPTQVSADSWAEAALSLPGLEALETDRFLGWDGFLDRITSANIPKGRKKADARSRLLWAMSLLEEQRKKPFLRSLMSQVTAPPLSVAPGFARLAPTLRGIAVRLRTLSGDLPGGEREAELGEYLELAEKYSRFLDQNLLYEPAHLHPSTDRERHYILFEPSLMPGHAAVAAELDNACSVEVHSSRAQGGEPEDGESPILQKFATLHDELGYVLASCASLIEAGLQPEDIAISFPNPGPEIQAHLRLIAGQWGLPVDFRAGKTLAASPFGHLLTSISRASAEGFSLRTLRMLFDQGAFRWKEIDLARKLIRFASRYHIPELSADRQYMSEIWKRTLSLCPDPGADVRAFHASLLKAARSIAGAGSFAKLRGALHEFKDKYLDEKDIDPEADRTLERIFEELDGFDQWHGYLRAPDLRASPLDILLLALDATPYRTAESANAISVYPYHLGMLLASPIHFVMDASQDSLKPARGYFSRIPEELRDLIGEEEIDEAVLSSFDAVHAVYCHAGKGLSGFSVPHPWFLRNAARQHMVDGQGIPPLPDALEARAWRDSAAGELPARLAARSLRAARGILEPDGRGNLYPSSTLCGKSRVAATALDPGALLALPACDAAPFYKISPGRLKSLMECPIKWFMTCVPGIDGGSSAAAVLAEGSLAHALIRTLLQDIALRDGGFRPERIEDYMGWLDGIFESALSQILRQDGPSLEPSLEAAYPKIRDRIARILDFETGFRAEGWDIGSFETTLSRTYAELGLSLEGRADRISVRSSPGAPAGSGAYAIIDYKKKNTPRKRDFLVDESGLLHDFQIAGYATMLEGEGKEVERALYWSIEESKAVTVFGPGGVRPDAGEFQPERVAFASALDRASRTIREGAFMAVRPTPEGCSSCPVRPICRAHFSSENP